jgi:hypothetical protein
MDLQARLQLVEEHLHPSAVEVVVAVEEVVLLHLLLELFYTKVP